MKKCYSFRLANARVSWRSESIVSSNSKLIKDLSELLFMLIEQASGTSEALFKSLLPLPSRWINLL